MTFKTKFKIGEMVSHAGMQRKIIGVMIACTATSKVIEYYIEDKFCNDPWCIYEADLLKLNPR